VQVIRKILLTLQVMILVLPYVDDANMSLNCYALLLHNLTVTNILI